MFLTIRRTVLVCSLLWAVYPAMGEESEKHLLYVAVPGVRNYTEYGGEGILVFDIDHEHRFVKRIPTHERPAGTDIEAIKGICANAITKRLYYSTTARLVCIDLVSEKILWNKTYDSGCDRMSITADGTRIYLPSGDWTKTDYWYVIDGSSGEVVTRVQHHDGTHNTVCGLDGKRAYLASLHSNELEVVDTKTNEVIRRIGPFGNVIRPFTVNGRQSLCFATVNDLLGFEVADLANGKVLHRVEVKDFQKGPTKRHGCPSHGVGLTPDEKEVWVTDPANVRMHVYDATKMPPEYIESIKLSDEPGWITFSIDGRFAYPSTCDVIDVKSRKVLTHLKDEHGQPIQSEKLLEIDFKDGRPIRAGDQFGLGRKNVGSQPSE